MQETVRIERDFDLPVGIVWDALVDPVLLEGWLGDVSLEPREHGRATIRFRDPEHRRAFDGEVEHVRELETLQLRDGEDVLRFDVGPRPGGTRGSSACVALTASAEPGPRSSAHWRTHLEALEDLLRGHPVVWERWAEEYAPFTEAFLRSGRVSAPN